MARRRSGQQQQGSTETKPNGGATTGHEAELWAMADALRGSMDAAEYKHVVLGLIFLKHISDAFEERRASVLAEFGEDAAEDRDEYVAEREKLIISAQVSTGLIDDVRVAVIPARRHGAIVGVALLLADLGLAPAIAPAFKEQDLDVVGQPVDQCDGARGVGEDGVPALERQVGGDEQGAVLVAAADELEEQVGGSGVVGEVAHLIDRV